MSFSFVYQLLHFTITNILKAEGGEKINLAAKLIPLELSMQAAKSNEKESKQ